MKNELKRNSVSIVVVAEFDLSDYPLRWFAESGILSEKEIAAAFGESRQDDSRIILKWERMELEIMKNKLQFLGAAEQAERISEIVNDIIKKKDLKIEAVGVNGEAIFRLDFERYQQIKNIIFPQNKLSELFGERTFVTEIQCHNNETIPNLHCASRLIEVNRNGAEISYSYNNHFPINEDNLPSISEIISSTAGWWNKMSNKFDTLLSCDGI